MNHIVPFIEKKLFLKVNREKTSAAGFNEVRYLGYGFYNFKGEYRFRLHPRSAAKMRDKIRELTAKSNGWGYEYRAKKITQYIRGWINYFKLAMMKQLMMKTDEWLRRKIRAVYWKQWKKTKTKAKKLMELGAPEQDAYTLANSRKAEWRTSLAVNKFITSEVIEQWGFPSMYKYYLKVCEN